MRFPADTQWISTSRRLVVEAARRGGATPRSAQAVALLTSEAVTNAIKYCGSTGGTIALEVEQRDGRLRVAVSDDNPEHPVVMHPAPTELGRRGVLLIDMLSDAWGVEDHPQDGKSVWFEVSL